MLLPNNAAEREAWAGVASHLGAELNTLEACAQPSVVVAASVNAPGYLVGRSTPPTRRRLAPHGSKLRDPCSVCCARWPAQEASRASPAPAFVRPEWLQACQAQGVRADVARFKLLPFAGLLISVTGLKEQVERDNVSREVAAGGGKYTGDLVKACTHLIARTAEGKKHQ